MKKWIDSNYQKVNIVVMTIIGILMLTAIIAETIN